MDERRKIGRCGAGLSVRRFKPTSFSWWSFSKKIDDCHNKVYVKNLNVNSMADVVDKIYIKQENRCIPMEFAVGLAITKLRGQLDDNKFNDALKFQREIQATLSRLKNNSN